MNAGSGQQNKRTERSNSFFTVTEKRRQMILRDSPLTYLTTISLLCSASCTLWMCVCVFVERRLDLRVWLITLILRGVGGDICSCTGVRARCVGVYVACIPHTDFMCDLRWVCAYVQSQKLVVANSVCLFQLHFTTTPVCVLDAHFYYFFFWPIANTC